ncbi:hypothetical protein EH165_10250 [Nakamurella antarctica]|uniref:Uncharacterized protein n=1 Tax=Nakamurella antarctica TaxID=1902245 RepID=A0A3G8ZVH0_9ACTN|nr:hypothetical protein [Nakamurella antarctica]AZI58464.1 hypothetical protein EH165_10250 [Nakamurella antarctica]
MGYQWNYVDEAGVVIEDELETPTIFETQTEAEDWLSEHFPDLLAQGIDAVVLHNEHGILYGPMPLTP